MFILPLLDEGCILEKLLFILHYIGTNHLILIHSQIK